jgi:hypothetical protein
MFSAPVREATSETTWSTGIAPAALRISSSRLRRRQRPVEPPARGGAARVVVDDVALPGRVHGSDHDDDRVRIGDLGAHRVEQLVAGKSLVGDDEELVRAGAHRTVSSSCV